MNSCVAFVRSTWPFVWEAIENATIVAQGANDEQQVHVAAAEMLCACRLEEGLRLASSVKWLGFSASIEPTS